MNRELNVEHHPSIDWKLSVKLANNNRDLAKDLLEMFIADLPKASDAIRFAFSQRQYQELISQVHRLHGASCFCGVTRLRALLAKMESAVREKLYPQFESLLSDFVEETKNVFSAYKLNKFEE
jgi:two-component system, NarL family, sensor histidine kinase BarA